MATGVSAPLYTTEILRLAASLEAPHVLDRIDGHAELRAPTCGSTVASDVKADADRLAALSQSVTACAFGQASASLVQKRALGLTLGEIESALSALQRWLDGTGDAPAGWGYEVLSPALDRKGRHGAILLPLRTLAKAMEAAR